ncbi:hypothetical protein ACYOEI_35455 [Singulisphaera rosea]
MARDLALRTPISRLPRFQFRVRVLIVVEALSALMMAYVGSYYRLSRRGMDEAQKYGLPGFLFVPMADAAESRDLGYHYAIATFYEPLNWIDRMFFGTPSPWLSIHWRLSG